MRFNDRVVVKEQSRCSMVDWDRDFDRSAKPYAVPLRRVVFCPRSKALPVVNYLEPYGRHQLHFPRARFIRDSCDTEREDDDGDIAMDLS